MYLYCIPFEARDPIFYEYRSQLEGDRKIPEAMHHREKRPLGNCIGNVEILVLAASS